MFGKNHYPKLKKIEKMMSNLKSLEDELRAKMSKNAAVGLKAGNIESREMKLRSICREIARNEAGRRRKLYFLQVHLTIKQGLLCQ